MDFYDFDLPRPLTPEGLESIEKRLRGIIQSKVTFERKVVSAEEAKQVFKDLPFKLELIAKLDEGKRDDDDNSIIEKPEINLFTQSTFTDLHHDLNVQISTKINPMVIKLFTVAGAYWRGDKKRPMLQRIY
jgi:threonyl-tRNA synthetase